MNIELRHLRYFVAVAEELHFGRAAARLNISQPPLSPADPDPEQQVGARLLARTNRSVALTSAGKQFLADSRQILGLVNEAAAGLSVCIWEKQGNCVSALRRRRRLSKPFQIRYLCFAKATRQCICKPAK